MPNQVSYDALIVGSGPNGLAAGIRLAQDGLSVLIVEASATIGGGLHSTELTLPGFTHDVCSAVHPLALGSPFFRKLPLEHYGLRWIHPTIPLAHPLDGGEAAFLDRSLDKTAEGLGLDGPSYRRIMLPLAAHWMELAAEFLQPLVHLPKHPLLLGRFGLMGLRSAAGLARRDFCGEPARALLAGLAAHSFLPMEAPASAAVGLVLGLFGHAVGWPFPEGGAQRLAGALAAYFRSLGGELATRFPVQNLNQMPPARAVLFDLTPRQLLRLAGDQLPASYRARLLAYRYGPGVFKIDYALDSAIPWRNADCYGAGTVHLGGTLAEIAKSERTVFEGTHSEAPFVLLAQPSLFDPSRAPSGKHTAWAYCHVPNGSSADMTEPIERQIERFAPGFRKTILKRHILRCADLEQRNSNLIGGDINGGSADLKQLLARPIFSLCPYRIPVPGWYLCSSSTPPGGGVHGMCGWHAAEAALKDIFRTRTGT